MDCASSWLGMIENPNEVLKSNLRVASSRYQQLEVSKTQLQEFRPLVLRIEHSMHLTSRLLILSNGKALRNLLIKDQDFPLQFVGIASRDRSLFFIIVRNVVETPPKTHRLKPQNYWNQVTVQILMVELAAGYKTGGFLFVGILLVERKSGYLGTCIWPNEPAPFFLPSLLAWRSICPEESSNPEDRQYYKRGPCKFLIHHPPLLRLLPMADE